MPSKDKKESWFRRAIKWLAGITSPSGSRWGIFAFLLAASFFLCEGSGMLDLLLPSGSIWQQLAFFVGIFFGVVAIVLGLLWLSRGSKDTTGQELENINRELKEIKDILRDRLPSKDGKNE